MATGGRVVHHLANRVGDRHNVVLLVGYQATGTRGAALAAGATSLRMLGRDFPVRARVLELLDDPAELDRILAANAARADEVADATLDDVYDKVGLLRRQR